MSSAISAYTMSMPGNTAITSQQRTYLSQCVDELNPEQAAVHARKEKLWKIASIISLVAFTALAVGGFVATGLFAPVYLPIAGITAVLLLPGIFKVYSQFAAYARQNGQKGTHINEIIKHHEQLKPKTNAEIQRLLTERRVDTSRIPADQLSNLKPLLARHLFLEDHMKELENQREKEFSAIQQITMDTKIITPAVVKKMNSYRKTIAQIDHLTLTDKVNTAFLRAVMYRPDFKGTSDDIFYFTFIEPKERILRNANGETDEEINNFVYFKGASTMAASLRDRFRPITVDEIKSPQPAAPDLSLRILEAMTAAV